MKRHLTHLWHAIVLATVSFVVIFAVVITLVRSATPFVTNKGPEVEQWISKTLNQPVQIKEFNITWHGLMPVLQGKQVIIWNDPHTHPLLKVDRLDVGISIFKSLLSGQLKFSQIKVSGVQLEAHQDQNDKIIFSGISALFPQTSPDDLSGLNEVMDWLFSESKLALDKVTLNFSDKFGKKWPTVNLNVMLKNSGDTHQLRGIANFIQKTPTQVGFIIDMKGAWAQKEKIAAQIYIMGEKVLLKQWLGERQFENFSVKDGALDFELWANWQDNHLTQLQTLFSSNHLTIFDTKKSAPIYFNPFAANVFWQSMQDNWLLDATVQQFGVTRWNNVPGVERMNAFLHVTPNEGSVVTNSPDIQLDFGKMFKAPLNFDEFSGQFTWQKTDEGWLIQSDNFYANNPDIELNAQLSVLLPPDKTSPELNILSAFRIKRADNLSYLLPLTVLKPNLVAWLNESIKQSYVAGTFILQGKADEFPYDDQKGTFLIDAELKDTTLKYKSAWPALKHFDANLIFAERNMEINISKGEMFDIPLQNVRAEIPIIKKDVQAVLHVSVDSIVSTLQQGLAFLKASPLHSGIAGHVYGLNLEGPMQMKLQLVIPLEDGSQKTQVDGHVDISKVQLKIPDRNLWLHDLQGQFSFTQDGVDAQGLTGVLWDKPIKIDIQAKPETRLTLTYSGTETHLLPRDKGWLLTVDNKTAEGDIFIPHSKQESLVANFKYLYLDSSQATDSQWGPTSIPELTFKVDELHYGDKNFGSISLRLSPMLGGTAIKELQANSTLANISASGSWRQVGKGTVSQLAGQLKTQDTSALLKSWGLAPSIHAKTGSVGFNLQWVGAPYDPAFKKMLGKISLHLQDGQIVDIGQSAEAKVSFGHLLTALSLQSIGKRLRLDFSDLNAKGFDFNDLKGDFVFQKGNAITNNASIDGPVALININGRIGLADKDYDLHIFITPHFTSSIPVIAALAGGPIIGLSVLVANTLLGSQVQKIATTEYHMTGPWSKPEVVEVHQQYTQ